MKELEGIKKITIPFDLPGGPGPINVYLFCGSPLSLIDTGIKSSLALRYLEEEIYASGYRLTDIERIYLTHGHLDHFGLANTLARISNATVFVHPNDKYKVTTDFKHQFDKEFPFISKYFKESGVPDKGWKSFAAIIQEMFQQLAEPVEKEVHTVSEGDMVQCGERKLRVFHMPGHTSGTVCYYDEESKLLFAGDHLLAEITPNPILELSTKANSNYRSLNSYLTSLKSTKELEVRLVLPGHGACIEDHRALIEGLLYHHEQRKHRILEIISRGRKSKWEISLELFGSLQAKEIFLGLSEVEGHMEILEAEGRINKEREGNVLYYHGKKDIP